jgi:hypothetical protein
MFDQMNVWRPWTIASSGVAMALGVLLCVAGTGILKHRRWGPRACLWWAILKIPLVAVNVGVGHAIQRQTWESMQSSGAGFPGGQGGFFSFVGPVTVVIGLLWGWTLPVFMLVWLSRRKIKADVAGWSRADERSMTTGVGPL